MKTLIKKTNIQEVKEHLNKFGIIPTIKTLPNHFSQDTKKVYLEMTIETTNERNLIKAFKGIHGIGSHLLNDDFHISRTGKNQAD